MGPRLRGDDAGGVAMSCINRPMRRRDLRIVFPIHMSNSHGHAFPRRRAG